MHGTLFLIPNTLGYNDGQQAGLLARIIPDTVQSMTANLSHFVVENAKPARAYLKLLAQHHTLGCALQDITMQELNVNTSPSALSGLLAPLLAGHDVGLISDAGVPAVADPGANLVRLAHQHGITVRPLVGPSSLLLALMGSGLNGQSFAFNGYLPTDAAARDKRIKELELRSKNEKQTQLLIETPYRNSAMLEALATTCHAQTLICVATDLTLPTESILTRNALDWKELIRHKKTPDFHKKPTVFLFLATH